MQRVYKYKELQELQSKLMLVAGKADLENEDVEQFTLVSHIWYILVWLSLKGMTSVALDHIEIL